MSVFEAASRPGFLRRIFGTDDLSTVQQSLKSTSATTTKDTNAQVMKDLRDAGYFDDHTPDPFFYRHYYF